MVTLYTTGCPKCRVLETKLDMKKILYNKVTDIDTMEKLGFSSAPILEVDGEFKEFGEANKWVTNYIGE